MNCARSRQRAISSGVRFRPFFKSFLQEFQDPMDVRVDICDSKKHSLQLLLRDERLPFHRPNRGSKRSPAQASISDVSLADLVPQSVAAAAAAAAATAAEGGALPGRASPDHRERGELLRDLGRAALRAQDLLVSTDELLEVRLALHADILVHRHRATSVLQQTRTLRVARASRPAESEAVAASVR
jgi:hypothetical protein